MKKYFFILLTAAMAAVSCSLDGGHTEQYQYIGHFEFNSQVYETEFGSDSLFFNATDKTGFRFGDIAYYHKLGSDNSFQGGFLLSCLEPTGLGEKKGDYVINSYRVVGHTLKKDQMNTYAVYSENKDASLMPEDDVKFLIKEYGTFKVTHCWVNNTEEVYDAVEKIFENGDKLTLTAYGYLDGAPTGTAEIRLASDTTMYNWTKFNLEKLGIVDEIEFQISSSRSDIPKAFCLDELTGTVSIEY